MDGDFLLYGAIFVCDSRKWKKYCILRFCELKWVFLDHKVQNGLISKLVQLPLPVLWREISWSIGLALCDIDSKLITGLAGTNILKWNKEWKILIPNKRRKKPLRNESFSFVIVGSNDGLITSQVLWFSIKFSFWFNISAWEPAWRLILRSYRRPHCELFLCAYELSLSLRFLM